MVIPGTKFRPSSTPHSARSSTLPLPAANSASAHQRIRHRGTPRRRRVRFSLSTGESGIDTASLHALTFGSSPSIVIPPALKPISDPVPMATAAFANLAISLYLPLQQISDVSVHSGANRDNYIEPGNHVSAGSLTVPVVVSSWYFVKGVDVRGAASHAAAVVAFGDSITDGAYATENANHRWPDYLADPAFTTTRPPRIFPSSMKASAAIAS